MDLNDNYGLYDTDSIMKLSYDEQQKYASEFSEGNIELKNLLLDCWNNGIGTFACCSGHNESNKISDPYIYFRFNDKSLNYASSILDSVKHGELVIKSFSMSNVMRDGFSIHGNYNEANDFFKRLRNLLRLRNIMCDYESDNIKNIKDLMDNSKGKFNFNLNLSRTITNEESLWLLCVNQLDPVGKRDNFNNLLDSVAYNKEVDSARYEVSDSSIKQLNAVFEGNNLTNNRQSVTI